MADLTGSSIATTYDQLLTLPSGGGDTTTLVALTDGNGVNTFCLQLATTKAMIEGNGSTLYFFDEGDEKISADNAGVLSIAGGAEIDITTPTVDINASTAVTVDGPSVAISSTSASEPVLHITNTHDGATSGELRFNKDSTGDDSDIMGLISFYGTDSSDNAHQRLAYMDEIITDSAHGSEAASMRFYVAENDATLTQGLALAGQADADGEIDVTIGAGAASTCTIAGDLTVNGDYALQGYSTGTNVLRVVEIYFDNATVADRVKITRVDRFNGDAAGAVDNCPKGTATGVYTLSAGGDEVTIDASSFTGNVVGIVSGSVTMNGTGTDAQFRLSAVSNNLFIELKTGYSGSGFDITDKVDTGQLYILVAYITDA